MKKITKGAIAAGAAALLLAGGTGTFMEWNQDVDIDGVSGINSGRLTLETTTDARDWTLNGGEAEISTVEIVPGDVLQLTQPIVVKAEGDNIQGVLSLVDGSIVAAGENPASEDLAIALTNGASFNLNDASGALTGPDEAGNFSFDRAGVYTADLIVNLDFGFESVEDLIAQDGSVSLEGIQVAVTQTDATQTDATP